MRLNVGGLHIQFHLPYYMDFNEAYGLLLDGVMGFRTTRKLPVFHAVCSRDRFLPFRFGQTI
jgi:hypothetical protein